MRLGLICCSKDKLTYPAPAKDMYITRVFKLRRKIVEETCDDWRIISAKGLLHPDTVIEPYDDWLRDAKIARRRSIQSVLATEVIILRPESVLLLAGAHYYEPILEKSLKLAGIRVDVPYRGLSVLHTFSAMKRDYL